MRDTSNSVAVQRFAHDPRHINKENAGTAQNWARRMTDLFAKVSDSRVEYDKRRHGRSMTKYLLENNESCFYKLRDWLAEQFKIEPIVSSAQVI
jgi:hypothetical protein